MSGLIRLGLLVPEDMHTAIKQESRKTKIPVSALVRIALEAMLVERGYTIENDVEWGGSRQGEAEPEK